jgi:hypothetical protein
MLDHAGYRERWMSYRLNLSSHTLVLAIVLQPLMLWARSQTDWTPGAVPMGSHIGLLAAFPVIKGQPYTADVVQQQTTILKNGTKRLDEAHNIHRRDSNGRLLDEQLPSPHVNLDDSEVSTQHSFALDDPDSMLFTQWDDQSRTVVVGSIPVSRASSRNSSEPHCPGASGYADEEQRDLGERTMQGVVAVGCQIAGKTNGEPRISVLIETWRSPVLGIPLLTTEHDSDGHELRTEVTRLDLGEPDLAKFQPPQDYKVIKGK